jgi:hypothetical protein
MLLQNRIRSVVFANVMFLETTVAASVLLLLPLLLLTSSAKQIKKLHHTTQMSIYCPLKLKKLPTYFRYSLKLPIYFMNLFAKASS